MKKMRLTLNLDEVEREELVKQARREFRTPRDQARYLLRCALLGNDGGWCEGDVPWQITSPLQGREGR